MQYFIFGCGDIGRRIAVRLKAQGVSPESIIAYVNTRSSFERARALGVEVRYLDLDSLDPLDSESGSSEALGDLSKLSQAYAYYTIAPQKSDRQDLRSRRLLTLLKRLGVSPTKLVLISTTGVYGDAQGEWIDETAEVNPSTDRAKRRFDSESVWREFMHSQPSSSILTILRVPGIYARSRLPEQRIKQATPVVRSDQVGFSNRIHADDLAAICVKANQVTTKDLLLNATDGTPGTITQYLQAVAEFLGEPGLPEITLAEAQSELSEGMLSYLSESRKISNARLLSELGYQFMYPDFREGMQY